jgi:hypothetical protein
MQELIESNLSSDEIVQGMDLIIEATTSVDVGDFVQHDFKLIPHDSITPEIICKSMFGKDNDNYQKCLKLYNK